ncbi:glycerophosphodiester phosphodiesterase family protein [Microbacterium indicum]|uniref:glycerophosphodiester phosphodiesterase family protein n=1 Tax=Microbacterium indicum TaxID=358100 RepID=UPI00048DF934|nr:glycerophosphodiester phosphodiesterase family protein [Microbacterium indicum]
MTIIIGHRGAPGYRPEHTRSSYEIAIAQGVDAVEPDVIPTRDGVLVVRHDVEISETTDVALHPEFADRRTTKAAGGGEATGWFVDDFTWAELATLRSRERIPQLRPESAAHDDTEPILRLVDVLDIARAGGVGAVVEIKHAAHFTAQRHDVAGLVLRELAAAGWHGDERPGRLVIESFEETVLAELRERGADAEMVYLVEDRGSPDDLVRERGADAPTYAEQLADVAAFAGRVDGLSLAKSLLLADPSLAGRIRGAGLTLFTWTCRPENAFLADPFRGDGERAERGDWRGEWERIRALGVDGVFADHPDLAALVFRDGAS